MATLPFSDRPLPPPGYRHDQRFFVQVSAGVAALVIFGFAQWYARGFVQPATVPFWVHLHGMAMVGWLGLFVLQNVLAGRGAIALHRRLGWASLALVAAIVVLGPVTVTKAVALHRVPPFFTNAAMLALSYAEVAAFVATFAIAIGLRRRTEWHRRLMLAATVVIMEPGLGRLLPMPLLGAAAPWVQLACQLGVMALVARHDRRVMGRIHPATLAGMGILVATRVMIVALAVFPPFVAIADSLAA